MRDQGTYTVVAGEYRATIAGTGAALVGLSYQGRELLYDATEPHGVPTPAYRGVMLLPWPNRIRDGRYEFAGEQHQLAVNEVDRGTALHGLTLWDRWSITQVSPSRLTLECPIAPRPGYPFALRTSTRFDLDPVAGLTIEVTTMNVGTRAAPYGASFHPYFSAGTSQLDDWTLQLPARAVLTVDHRLLPLGNIAVAGTRFDFTSARSLQEVSLDHAFAGVSYDRTGQAWAQLRAADGCGVQVGWDAGCGWVQVYTLDQPELVMHRRAVAIEPMTCAPDAFNSGNGLVVISPGQEHRTRWQIAALSA